ncbi:MAG: TonB-dependent receptor [Bacteroidota bacterium]
MQRIFFTVLSFLLPCLTMAQATLQGSVYNKATGSPLRGVTVSVLKTTLSTQSDKYGFFAIKGLQPGVYHIRFSRPGFRSGEQEIVVKKERLLSTGIALFPSVIQISPDVLITGQRYARDPFLTPAGISAIEREAFLHLAPANLGDALKGMTGTWIPDIDAGNQGLRIRGLGGSRTLLLVDGIRLNHAAFPAFEHPILGMFDPHGLQRTEILRGAGSVEYGNDALGGVAHMITRNPDFSDQGIKAHGAVSARYAGAGMGWRGRSEWALSSAKVAVSGGYTYQQVGDRVPGSKSDALTGTGFNGQGTDLKVRVKLSPRHQITVANQYVNQVNVPDYLALSTGGYQQARINNRDRLLTYARLSSFTKMPWLSEIKVTSSWQHFYTRRTRQLAGNAPIFRGEDRIRTWGGTVEVRSIPNPYWNIVSGVEYYQDQIKSEAGYRDPANGVVSRTRPALPNAADASNLSLYSLHTLDLLKLRLTFGGRAHALLLEAPNETPNLANLRPVNLTGNISGLYPLHPKYHLVSAFRTGYRVPNLYDQYGFSPLPFGFGAPADSLGAERSFTSEIGLKAKTSRFSGSLIFYRTQLTDFIDWENGAYNGNTTIEGRQVFQQSNQGQAFIQGVEAEVEVPLTTLVAFYGGLTYTQGYNITQDAALSRIPPLNSRLGVQFRSPKGVWSRLEWRHAAQQDLLSPLDQLDPGIDTWGNQRWNVVDLHVGYDFTWGYATIGIQNMLDERYAYYGSGIAAPGRSILLSLQLGF